MAGEVHSSGRRGAADDGHDGAGCTISLDSQSQIVREAKRFTVTGAPDLHVITFDGAIRIQSWDRAEVFVEIETRGPTRESIAALEVKTTQNGDRIERCTPATGVACLKTSISRR